MPKIPISKGAGFVQHTEAGHLNIRERLHYYDDHKADFWKGLSKLGDSLYGIGMKGIEFAEKLQDSENALAAGEYRAAWNKREAALEDRMNQNPGEVENFGKWAEESDKEWQKESEQFTSRMSKTFRANFENNFSVHRQNALSQRRAKSFQAAVTRQRSMFDKLAKDAAEAGDYDMAEWAANEAAACGVITPAEQDNYLNVYIPQMRDFNAVNERINKKDYSVIADLQKNVYTTLDEKQKRAFISAARSQQTEDRLEWESEYTRSFVAGNPPYNDMKSLESAFTGGVIDTRQYNYAARLIEARDRQRSEARIEKFNVDITKGITPTAGDLKKQLDSGKITRAEYLYMMGVVQKISDHKEKLALAAKNRADNMRKVQAAEMEKRKITAIETALNAEEANEMISLDPQVLADFKDKYYRLIEEASLPPEKVYKLQIKVNDLIDKVKKGKGEFSTPEGRIVRKYIQRTFRDDDLSYKGLGAGDGIWWSNIESGQQHQMEQYNDIMWMAREMLAKGKGSKEVIDTIDGMVKEMNNANAVTTVRNIWYQRKQDAEQAKKEAEQEAENAALAKEYSDRVERQLAENRNNDEKNKFFGGNK